MSIQVRFVYLVLLVALVPLGVSTFRGGDDDDVSERLQRTLESLGESEENLSEPSSVDEFFNRMPGHRIEGAALAHDSWMHWSFALASSIVFFPLILAIFPCKKAEVPGILLVGLFSATIGIVLLLVVQWIADWTQGRLYMGRSILVVFFYIAKFIGFSYWAALDPENGFIMSCFGFTLGVGLCEEICKALPLLYRYRAVRELSLKSACLWGLASVAGFGISEGITQSSDFYNGIKAVRSSRSPWCSTACAIRFSRRVSRALLSSSPF